MTILCLRCLDHGTYALASPMLLAAFHLWAPCCSQISSVLDLLRGGVSTWHTMLHSCGSAPRALNATGFPSRPCENIMNNLTEWTNSLMYCEYLWIIVWCIVNYCDKFWPYVRIGNLENSTNKTLIKWYQVLVGTADFYLGRTIRSRTVRPVQTYLAKLSGIIGLLRLSQVSWFSCADSSLQTSATAVQDSETCRARHPMYALLCAMRRRKMKKVCWETSCCCSCRTRHETTAMMRRASTVPAPCNCPENGSSWS